ncbi:hypothetical protein I6N90_00665 [Paenibacillus sp. GSMTC-2017]|uniref:hypothetical protein n=1 Tax=Paenibacillus sp. GSMTC-2017 TaxID=2794350 RepID=UPI0018D80212|nr:hypothetical protein [Paenibacillus sp. GSMTC-2017]MBH5316319.1 hypothetical protein [Paenibacillus sp. GSMTC-2017]
MKKFWSFCLVGVLSFGLIGSTISAKQVVKSGSIVPNGFEIVKTYKAFEPLSKQNMKQLGLPDQKIEPQVTSNSANEKIEFETLENETRPVHDLRNKLTGEIVTQYESNVVVLASSATYSTNGSDSTLSVRAYGTLFYIFSGSVDEYAHLDKVSWRYEISDNNARIVNKTHKFVQSGAYGGRAVNQNKTLNPTATSGTDLVRDWGWSPVDTLAGYWKLGVEMNATIGRTNNSSTWTMQILVFRSSALP